jgi:hypothetical protein
MGGRLGGSSMRDSATSARSEASAPFGSATKLSGWKRA